MALCRRDCSDAPTQRGGYNYRSINVRVGKLKSVLDQLESRLFVFRQHDFDNIKAKKNVGVVEQPQPGESADGNARTLVASQVFDRPSPDFVRASFYLHENQRVAIAANDVDFAPASAAKIAIENFVTAPPKKTAGKIFATFAASNMLRLRFRARNRKAAAPPAQTTGDGWGRVRIHVV